MVKKRNECTEKKRIGGFVFVGSRDWLGMREREREGERKASVLVKLEWNFERFEAWKRMKSERQPSGFLAKCA